jgi:sugar/nucleoside kinase (ribokinase family)
MKASTWANHHIQRDMRKNAPDFLVIGHLCHDRVPGGYSPGGAVAYAGLQAARLGYKAAALTSFGDDFNFAGQFQELELAVVSAEHTTVFENIYRDGERIQYLHEKALDLSPAMLPAVWRQAATVMLGPICDEVSLDFLQAFDKAVICACPQGWMRQWNEQGLIFNKPFSRWQELTSADIISMSESDVACDWGLIEQIASLADILLVTRGAAGAVVFHRGQRQDYPSFQTREIDPTGAGDIFATAFTLHYAENRNIPAAVNFAHAAASLNIEGTGMTAIPSHKAVEKRLAQFQLGV